MIRIAKQKDVKQILNMLSQVLEIHAKIRPDLFIPNTTKYTENELLDIISNEKTPIYVYTNKDDIVIAYAFCIIKEIPSNNNMKAIKTLYIDDFCVDEKNRGNGIGKSLFDFLKEECKNLSLDSITLNVWEGNESAKQFYNKIGMKPKKIEMEYILK